jgi:hypothetical protein
MIGLAGDGKLRDGSKASEEFREFLTNVPSIMLGRYANECLGAEKFSEASAALQDVINEVGRRLGFKVQNGLYRGKVNEIGNDGLWHSDDSSAIILETKTTDTYTIELGRCYIWFIRSPKIFSLPMFEFAGSRVLCTIGTTTLS